MASTSFHTRWSNISDADLTVEHINELLEPVEDDLWVAAACVDKISGDVDVQRALLQTGLARTEHAVKRCKTALDSTPSASHSNTNDLLLSHFNASKPDAQLCSLRAVLLGRLDRLNSYIAICKESPEDSSTESEKGLDEWEDDPWADDAEDAAAAAAQTPKQTSDRPTMSLSAFLVADLLFLACQMATEQQFGALQILFDRHSLQLHPHRFQVLDSIPEHAHPLEYRQLLPALDFNTKKEQVSTVHKGWRGELDFAEMPEVREAVATCRASLYQPHCTSNAETHFTSLSAEELTHWYKSRVDRIMTVTGMVDIALTLIQHGASQGVPDLDELGEELILLSRLVYDATQPEESQGPSDDWTLDKWRSMDPTSTIRAYLAYSTSETLPKDITRLVLPYIFVLEARAERSGTPDSSLHKRLLYEYMLSASLGTVAAIFEVSKPTLPAAQRLIRDDEDMARLALACLYGSASLTEWSTMGRIFECLPAWNIDEQDADKDAADTTISSLGAFLAPSPSRSEVTAHDLLVFFNPLPISSLSRALDILDVHLESGEVLARWNAPAPLRWFLRSNSDVNEQCAWANRMARRAGGTEDQLSTLDDWEWLLEDMLKLAGSGGSGLEGAFGLLSPEEIERIFLSGLLSTGSMLHTPHRMLFINTEQTSQSLKACYTHLARS